MAPPLIVCLSSTDWGSVRHRERHLMERLSRHTTVVFVNPPRAVRSREWPFRRRTHQVSSTLWVHEPFVMPGTQRSSLASEITYGWLAARLEQWRHQRQCVLWLCSPHGLPFIDLLKPDRVVFDVAPLHATSHEPDSRHEREPSEIAALAAFERQLLPRVDMALCASEPLMEAVSARARRAFLVPNGCDWQSYIRSQPPAIAGERPRIGYIGGLTPQFDVDLVASLARRRTDWTIELVGPTSIDASALEPLSNVVFTGEIPFDDVPAKMSSFDVCVLPLRDTPFAYYCSPIEAFDYLAAGKPIVSSPIGQLECWPGLVHFARSAEEFETQIEIALGERTREHYSGRRVFAARNSWDVRITQILSALSHIGVDLAGDTADRQLAA
jgi:glycosyltransferase involved in cell wall biosynthesis